MRKMITKNCKKCDKEFTIPLSEHKRGNGKFCSLSCSSSFTNREKHSQKEHNCKCHQCGKTFYRNKSKMKMSQSGLQFCSRQCKDFAQSLEGNCKEIQPNHYGNGSDKSTYRKLAFKHNEHCCNRCGYNEYPEILEVHHIDRDRENNQISNLEILCPNCHKIEHFLTNSGAFHLCSGTCETLM